MKTQGKDYHRSLAVFEIHADEGFRTLYRPFISNRLWRCRNL